MNSQTEKIIEALNSKEPIIRVLAKSMHTNLIIVNDNGDYQIKGMDLVINEVESLLEHLKNKQ